MVDKLVSTGAGLEGATAVRNCSLTELHRKDHRCNFTHQTVGLWASVYHTVVVLLTLKWIIASQDVKAVKNFESIKSLFVSK